jgi:glycosyltransferase involved in cell wall biosynthesis
MIQPRKLGFVRRISNSCIDVVITVSKANVPFLHSKHGISPGKIVVVHNGVAIETRQDRAVLNRDTLGLGADEFVVGFVGSLTERKGHRIAFKALKMLQEERAPVRLVLVGDGELEPALRNAAVTEGLEKQIHFLGHRDDVRSVMGLFDVLVLPSFMEGLPLVILEAMAEGLPVVATDVYGVPEAVVDGETGYVIKAGDAPALAHRIKNLAQSQELCTRMGENGKARALEHFSQERMVAETEQVYRNLL